MTVFLGIPPNSGIDWTGFSWFPIRNDLEKWIRASCPENSTVRVITTNRVHPMSLFDGLVYLVGHRSDSIIARAGAPESSNLTAGQTSLHRDGWISEVYVNPLSAYGIAATIFHELLHNKFQNLVNIHATPDGNFTTATAPYSLGGPSDADQNLMCRALKEQSKQYQGALLP